MTDRGPLVSVIVTAYNAQETLARTLDSISAQTYRNLEILVRDDGSTDATLEVAEAAARRDPRIRVLSGPNLGMAGGRNAAISEARGDALAPCDADDLWRPEKVERQVEALYGASPETGVAYCWSCGIDEDDGIFIPTWKGETHTGDVFEVMITDSLPGCGSVPLIRRDCFDRAGGYPADAGLASNDDWRFYISLAAICEFVVVPERLVGYRFAHGNHSADVDRMERFLGESTDWIVETWPDLPRALLRRRSRTIHRYLAFLAARRRRVLKALGHRVRAELAWPRSFLDLSWMGFAYVLVAELVGLHRYYFPPWRRPTPWDEDTRR